MKRRSFKRFIDQVEIERMAQHAKWGDQHHFDGTGRAGDDMQANRARSQCNSRKRVGLDTWRDILNEEIHEAFAERETKALRGELIQCAAVIAAWLEDMDTDGRT